MFSGSTSFAFQATQQLGETIVTHLRLWGLSACLISEVVGMEYSAKVSRPKLGATETDTHTVYVYGQKEEEKVHYHIREPEPPNSSA